MGLLPDWEIEQAIKIEPFAKGPSRPGTISYGVTSYGYDVRVGRHFKVFTNVYGAIIDPKNFSQSAFVDLEADYCVIPPNSFALAETVETFEIPRDVLAICLGKSTYARCFRADTRVALVDGTAPTLEELARRSEAGEMFWGYSIGPLGRLMVTLLETPRYIGRDPLVEVRIDQGEPIFCTPDHLFLMRDGRMVPAEQLRPGDSLMSLCRHAAISYEDARHHHSEELSRMSNSASGTTAEMVRPRRGNKQPDNRKVVALRPVSGLHDVYCLTVPEAGNFALESGVFVHNCGIIVNVTPLEPEWRGKVTIEISNTTPLPAKIYANEGIAQILFLRADAVCRVSYADKRGKYQDQKGLTLPFVKTDDQ